MLPVEAAVDSTAVKNAAAVEAARAALAVQEVKAKALEDEVKTLKEFVQHILATVYFSLGTVIVLAAALIAYSWYQNFRVYERDKESINQSIRTAMTTELSKGLDGLKDQLRQRVLLVDEKFAAAVETVHKRIVDLQLDLAASLFTVAHEQGKTPRTDFYVLLDETRTCMPLAEHGSVHKALGVIAEYLERLSEIDMPTRTAVLDLVNRLPPEQAAFDERIRTALGKLD